jgi:hypothetical protein
VDTVFRRSGFWQGKGAIGCGQGSQLPFALALHAVINTVSLGWTWKMLKLARLGLVRWILNNQLFSRDGKTLDELLEQDIDG